MLLLNVNKTPTEGLSLPPRVYTKEADVNLDLPLKYSEVFTLISSDTLLFWEFYITDFMMEFILCIWKEQIQ